MVGYGGGCVSFCSRSRFSKKLSLGSQRLDGSRPCHGSDQHEDHTGFCLLRSLTPIGIVRRLLGKDPMGRQFRPDLDSYRITVSPDRHPI